MARRRKAEDDAADWVPPPFSETDFMKQEIGAAKASVVSVLYAVLVAVASYAITLARLPAVGFLVGFGLIFALRYLMPIVRIDTSKFKRRDWLGHGSIVFFSWLAFWILLLNAPFADLTRPDMTAVFVATTANTSDLSLACKGLVPGPNAGALSRGNNTLLYVTFRATDNVAVASTQATVNAASVTLASAGGNANRCDSGTYPGGTREGFVSPIPPNGLVVLAIQATDTSGNSYALNFQFTVGP